MTPVNILSSVWIYVHRIFIIRKSIITFFRIFFFFLTREYNIVLSQRLCTFNVQLSDTRNASAPHMHSSCTRVNIVLGNIIIFNSECSIFIKTVCWWYTHKRIATIPSRISHNYSRDVVRHYKTTEKENKKKPSAKRLLEIKRPLSVHSCVYVYKYVHTKLMYVRYTHT